MLFYVAKMKNLQYIKCVINNVMSICSFPVFDVRVVPACIPQVVCRLSPAALLKSRVTAEMVADALRGVLTSSEVVVWPLLDSPLVAISAKDANMASAIAKRLRKSTIPVTGIPRVASARARRDAKMEWYVETSGSSSNLA